MSTSVATSSLDKILAATHLPALPQTAIALLQLSQQTDKGPSDFARPIEADPGLAGQVLRFVNSSHFGFSREISSVQQSLTLVGTRTITNFALWNAVFSVVPNPQFGAFDLKGLWSDSLRRAVFARKLGKAMRLAEAEDLFAAALLQDMAIPLLLKFMPGEYTDLMTRRLADGMRLSQLERQAFGWDHAEAASKLARSWKLPESFAHLIERHTQLDGLLSQGTAAYGQAAVALASMLPDGLSEFWSERNEFVAGFDRLTAGQAGSLATIFQETDEDAAQFAPLLKLAMPKKSLAAHLGN
ncbi:HDOD domain-containing protein [Planctomycetaceae bacterium SH139]